MARTVNNMAALEGVFKEVYADKILDLLPSGVKLQKAIPFVSKNKEQGGKYNQPVLVAHEHGMTFAGASVDDAFSLNAPVSAQTKNAQVDGCEMLLRTTISYKVLSRADGATAEGRKAFVDGTKHAVTNMAASFAKKLEIVLLYGGVGIGKVASVAADVITLAASDFAPGIWAGAEGMPIQAHDPADGTVQNTGGVTTFTADASKSMIVSSVDIAARTVTVETGHAVGIAANDVLYFAGAKGNEFLGLHAIMANTGSLFGISAASYAAWKGSSYAVGGALSVAKILEAVQLAVAKGLEEDCTLWLPSRRFADLQQDLLALRHIDASYKSDKTELGEREIRIHSQAGVITIKPGIYFKEGFAYLTVDEDFVRVGSQDVSFKRPGGDESFLKDMDSRAGIELRMYTDQALFCERPARQVLLTGITD